MKRKRIAFLASELCAPRARGVTRQARATLTACLSSPAFDFECVALCARQRRCHEITYACEKLDGAWLGRHPLLLAHSQEGGEEDYVSLNELDAVVSFDPGSEIHALPTEMHRAKIFSWVLDLIPFQLYEGPHAKLEEFMTAISNVTLRSNWIFAISKCVERNLNELYPASRGKSSVVYLGFDRRPPGCHDRPPHTEGRPYFLALGSMDNRKNLHNIGRALLKLEMERPGLELDMLIAGDTANMIEPPSAFQELRKIKVSFKGYLPDEEVKDLLGNAKALLYPSLVEGFGFPPLEAADAGTLCITSSLSATGELYSNHALLCDPFSPDSICRAMKRALDMPEGERARRIADFRAYAQAFSWERVAKEMLEIICLQLNGH